MRRIYFIVFLLVAFGAAYCWHIVSLHRAEVVQPSDCTKSPSELPDIAKAVESQPDYPALFWRKGDRRMYNVSMTTDYWLMSSFSNGQSSEEQGQQVFGQIDGILNLRILDFDGTGVWAAFQLSPVSVRFGGSAYPLLEEVYSTFFLVAFLRNGKIWQSYFPDTIGEQEQKSLLEILHFMQVEMPENGHKTDWTVEENNATGTYNALYTYLGAGNLSKKKLAYSAVNSIVDSGSASSSNHNFEVLVLESRYEAFLSSQDSWLDKAKIFDSFELREMGNTWAKSKVALDLWPQAFNPNMELRIWQEEGSIKEIISSFVTPPHLRKMSKSAFERQRLDSLRQKWAGVTVHEMGGKAQDLFHDNSMTQHDFMNFVHGLVDMLEAFPERAGDIPQIIREMNLNGETAALLLQALELCGHAEAQNALEVVLLDEEIKNDVRVYAIVASGGLKNPQENVLNAIWSLVGESLDLIQVDSSKIKQTPEGEITAEDRKILEDSERISTALLAAGILSRTYRDNGFEAKADEINRHMAELLAESSAPDAMSLTLKAFDNSGSISAIEDISPYVTAESTAVRAAAVAALKNRDDNYALELLSDRLEKDPALLVRSHALDALEVREPATVVEKYAVHLPKEEDFSLRMRMADWLGRNKGTAPVAASVLQEQLNREESREVVKEIYKAIYRKENKIDIPLSLDEEQVIYVLEDKTDLFADPSPVEKMGLTSSVLE